MSEGEVGYVYTSNSYSSGEIVERKTTSDRHKKETAASGKENEFAPDCCPVEAMDEKAESRIELNSEQKNFSSEDSSDSTTTSETC
ncbi:Hypothetical protein NTJ_13720 [Nesidiocoris tenuis]|uniref:Uncharacterized protein n=1 Tax=Nesidiocoris tenuis TaxID=355587 RepID=A0ABN7B934_9HEMI|nr:Hypothetical protein NTJ_13720 [Nesidiocoris tenuis]